MLTKIRKIGIRFSLSRVFNRIVPKSVFRMRRYVIYQMDIAAAVERTDQILADSEHPIVLSLCQSEVETQAVESLTWFRREFSSGPCWAYQAKRKDQLVGGFWAARDRFDEDELGVQMRLAPHQAWLFAALVANEARGQGVYGRLLPFTIADVSKNGFTNITLAVNPDNLASNAVHRRWATTTLGTVIAVRLFWVSFCWSTGKIVTDRSFSLNSKKRPILLSLNTD